MRSDKMRRWDNRRSGRTTRMLAAAFARAYAGNRVAVVIPEPTMFKYCAPILRDLGVTRISEQNHLAMVGSGTGAGVIYFVNYNSEEIVSGTFGVKDFHPDNVFWDHESVRRACNRIIEEYHRYD